MVKSTRDDIRVGERERGVDAGHVIKIGDQEWIPFYRFAAVVGIQPFQTLNREQYKQRKLETTDNNRMHRNTVRQ